MQVADKMRKQATTALRAYQQQQQQQQQQQIVGVNSGDDTSLPQPTPRGSTDAALVTKLHSQNRWAPPALQQHLSWPWPGLMTTEQIALEVACLLP
jgi:type II secretory pathway pseudopilin PulG